MENKKFINDWHTIVNFGMHKGKQLMDLPEGYIKWITDNMKHGPVYEAVIRINNRKGVTSLISNSPIDSYIPIMKKGGVLPTVERPNDINPALFGSFIEYLVKYNLGLRKNDGVTTYLSQYGLATIPDHLKLFGNIQKPTTRARYIANSFKKEELLPSDICNLSFAHALNISTINEEEASILFKYVLNNQKYFIEYGEKIKECTFLPKLSDDEQETCDKISVGCVIGEIDILSSTDVIDIKCCIKDDLEYYRKQLFAYACLHRLRYGKIITQCKIFNFHTGKIFIMEFGSVSDDIILNHIKNMGKHCKFHSKLFE